MRMHSSISRAFVVAGLALSPTISAAQPAGILTANTGGGPVIRNAPYSGEAVTTIKQTLYDGTKIERTLTASIHRDSAGRVRREQPVFGLAAVNPQQDSAHIVNIVDPVAGVIWSLMPA